MKARLRKKTSFVPSRWAAYAAAAGATTFGATAAEAEIHYSGPVREVIANSDGSASAKFPLSEGVSIQLYAYSRARVPSYNTAGFAVLGADVSQGFRASALPPIFGVGASRLPAGEPVSQGLFRATHESSTIGNIRSFYGGGHWPGGQGFIGFKFNDGAGTQYGWARVKITPYPRVKLEVIDYAWGDPGDAIATGQKRSNATAATIAPKPGSLGLLALGGAGLLAWREAR